MSHQLSPAQNALLGAAENGFAALTTFAARVAAGEPLPVSDWHTGAALAAQTAEQFATLATTEHASPVTTRTWARAAASLRATAAGYRTRAEAAARAAA
ncbi:hypothetical protein AB0F91_39815 [Amycolatopsis sp. NPDC023774]|uniref:hypothetical protein n=1 Tax=Amycolatopsis sp. NPDC023774 TaxID=3155015 RepID=UPI0034052470